MQIGAGGSRFDAVFSDVVMPGIGGLELARRLKRENPDVPVVLATGYSDALAQEGVHGSASAPKALLGRTGISRAT